MDNVKYKCSSLCNDVIVYYLFYYNKCNYLNIFTQIEALDLKTLRRLRFTLHNSPGSLAFRVNAERILLMSIYLFMSYSFTRLDNKLIAA